MSIIATEKRQQLIREGFYIFENVLETELASKLNARSKWTIAQEHPEHFNQDRGRG